MEAREIVFSKQPSFFLFTDYTSNRGFQIFLEQMTVTRTVDMKIQIDWPKT